MIATVAGAMRKYRGRLGACMGAPGPHDFAVRADAARQTAPSRPPHPASTSVTTRTSLFIEAGRGQDATDLGRTQSELFLREDLDDPNQLERLCEIRFSAHAMSRALKSIQ
ncbi:hypothetical protein [Bradyrhizobium sp. ARR65]|uniref:hypothetical protein n=1 Tax=Bradyrhizobium sp. ARR65 TaxID=1040989 RepID=UPI000ADC702B|nr:hypothetical protein [Bradyrhizobium sp. ARR65]